MGRYRLYDFTKDEMIKIYEKEIKNGKTFFGICKQLGVNTQTLQEILRSANYTYSMKHKRYIKDTSSKRKKEIIPGNNPDQMIKNSLGEVTNNDLLKQIKSIQDEIKNINSRIDKGIVRETLNQDIITGAEIEVKNIKQTSIKVDEDTINRFNELCKEYEHINKSYMLSLAIKEFCDKYEK